MPYAPTVNDNSGQILAQGINQGISALAQGLQRNFEERKKKEEEKKAKEAVMSAGKGLFGDAFDLKDAPQETWGTIIQLSQAKQQEPLRQLAQENAQLRQNIDLAQLEQMSQTMSQQQTDRSAINAAVASPWADQSMSGAATRALQRGATPKTAMELAQMGEVLAQTNQRTTPPPSWSPTMVDVGDGRKALMTSPRSAVPVKDAAAPVPRGLTADLMNLDAAAKQAEAAGDTALAATLRQAMQSQANRGGGEKPATTGNITAAMMAANVISETQNYLKQNPKAGFLQSQATYDAEVLRRKAAANAAAQAIGETPPYPEAMREKGVKQPNLTSRPGPQASPTSSRFKIVPE